MRVLLGWVMVCALMTGTPTLATTGFAFLRLGEGARDAAMGDATVAVTSYTADAANPAALARGQQALTFSHTEWIEQIRHEYVGTLWSIGKDVIALSTRVSHTDGLEHRVGASLEPLGEFGVYEWTAGAAWSHAFSQDLRLGVGLRFVRQSIFDEAASGGHADAGLLYRAAGWDLGISVRNVGTMNELNRVSTELPLQLRVGGARRHGKILFAAAGHWSDASTDLHAGVEWAAREHLNLRLGYDSGGTRGLSYGAGVELAPWRVDYAYLPFGDGFGPAHRFSLRWAVDTVPAR